jgi:phage/plasmid-associated DNA primase
VDEVVEGLQAEAPGILQNLVSAVVEWIRQGKQLGMPGKAMEATSQYLSEQDPLVTWMEMCCEPGGERVEEPFAIWYWSFIEQSGRDPRKATKQWFGRKLEAKGFLKREAYNGKFYTGPCLTEDARSTAAQAWVDDDERNKRTYHYSTGRRVFQQSGSLV